MASETPASSLAQTATSSTSTSTSNNPTLFAPGSFPPIIVGFLGLGLVTAVIIALSGYRRFRRGRRGPPHGGPPGGSTGVGDRPKLWDLWTEGNVGGKASFWDHGSWENITPVSVMTIAEYGETISSSPQPHNHSPGGAGYMITIPLRVISRYFERFIIGQSDHDLSPKADAATPTVQLTRTSTTLQVAVAIAMPSPRSNKRAASGDGSDDHEVLEYSMGLWHVPWQNGDSIGGKETGEEDSES